MTQQKTEKEYRQVQLDSSSSLKEFSIDKRKYKKKYIDGIKEEEEEDSKASVIGRIVETMLFEPNEFDNRFYMSSAISAPTGLMLDFVEALYKCTVNSRNEEGKVENFEECLRTAYKESKFKISFEKVIERFTEHEIYYREILEVRSKELTVVTLDDVKNAEKTVDELKRNEFTGKILNLINSDRYEVLTQYQIEDYEINGLKLKSMLDLLIIDHKEKTISPFDLKCTWSVEGFYKDYYLYRRAYIQAYLYKEACLELKQRRKLDLYRVDNVKFIVCDSINYYSPLIYSLDTDDMQDAYDGFEHKGEKYPGVKQIIKDLKWSKENNRWNISRKNYENEGIVNIKG